jgi:hypothetical protein
MTAPGRTRVGTVVALLLACTLAAGCVNHGSNSAAFCRRNAALLESSHDRDRLSEDQAVFVDDQLQKTMRYSEDGSRSIRSTARKLADAYSDVRSIAGDDGIEPAEVDETYDELELRRAAMRSLCEDVRQ